MDKFWSEKLTWAFGFVHNLMFQNQNMTKSDFLSTFLHS